MSADTGRPSPYSDEILKKAHHYAENYAEYGDVVPTIEGLSLALNVCRSTVYNWSRDEQKEEFLHIFNRLMSRQGKNLLNGGLMGTMNPAITKMMLAKHGYTDKVETKVDHTSSDGSMSPTRIEIVCPDDNETD